MREFKNGQRVTISRESNEICQNMVGYSGVIIEIAPFNGKFGIKYEGWAVVDFQEELFFTHDYGVPGGNTSIYLCPPHCLSSESDEVKSILQHYEM